MAPWRHTILPCSLTTQSGICWFSQQYRRSHHQIWCSPPRIQFREFSVNIYPLVICYIAIENCPLWIIYLFKMVPLSTWFSRCFSDSGGETQQEAGRYDTGRTAGVLQGWGIQFSIPKFTIFMGGFSNVLNHQFIWVIQFRQIDRCCYSIKFTISWLVYDCFNMTMVFGWAETRSNAFQNAMGSTPTGFCHHIMCFFPVGCWTFKTLQAHVSGFKEWFDVHVLYYVKPCKNVHLLISELW